MFSKHYETTLVIGDPHSDPVFSNERFTALGNLIVTEQPNNIVQIGDFMSLDSVSTHTITKPLLREGRRLIDDLTHGKDAYDRMMNPMKEFNARISKLHKKKYTPVLKWLNANHEDRVYRYIQQSPELLGLLNHNDLINVRADNWDVLNYREYAFINGVGFTHVPMCKRLNQPITGEYICKKAAEMHGFDIFFGHTHRLGVHDSKRHGQDTNYAVNVGWFGDYIPEYVQGNEQNVDWWSGVIMITHTNPGIIISPIPMSAIKREYL